MNTSQVKDLVGSHFNAYPKSVLRYSSTAYSTLSAVGVSTHDFVFNPTHKEFNTNPGVSSSLKWPVFYGYSSMAFNCSSNTASTACLCNLRTVYKINTVTQQTSSGINYVFNYSDVGTVGEAWPSKLPFRTFAFSRINSPLDDQFFKSYFVRVAGYNAGSNLTIRMTVSFVGFIINFD